ncbi:basic blue protein, partial [Trifolium medium]|nr:basic blue protein [Trifolium medium]
PAGAQVLRTGNDEIELASGANYFICIVPGHCQTGMKIFINVA